MFWRFEYTEAVSWYRTTNNQELPFNNTILELLLGIIERINNECISWESIRDISRLGLEQFGSESPISRGWIVNSMAWAYDISVIIINHNRKPWALFGVVDLSTVDMDTLKDEVVKFKRVIIQNWYL